MGNTISERGMVPGSEDMLYIQLRVAEPLTVSTGTVAGVPEFGAVGGGIQYAFYNSIDFYIAQEILEIIPK